ncbi:MAG TPA: hypothetical protein DIW24_03820 [Bacteroidetes bacterium]|nr:hypothetical protein [Bacteroidota bacterium]HRR07378.1 hypothetical protein [Rhodothermales bacterium]
MALLSFPVFVQKALHDFLEPEEEIRFADTSVREAMLLDLRKPLLLALAWLIFVLVLLWLLNPDWPPNWGEFPTFPNWVGIGLVLWSIGRLLWMFEMAYEEVWYFVTDRRCIVVAKGHFMTHTDDLFPDPATEVRVEIHPSGWADVFFERLREQDDHRKVDLEMCFFGIRNYANAKKALGTLLLSGPYVDNGPRS